MPKNKKRLDILLVERGLCESRQKAQAEILSGHVFVNERNDRKAGTPVDVSSEIRLKTPFPYVSRGALKLLKALEVFEFDTDNKIIADIGSSTGGFTEVLIEKNARLVYAVDSGRAQLHWKLRQNPRVVVMEHTNARFLTVNDFKLRPEAAVMDVSFISTTLLLPVLCDILAPGFSIITLIKPQFELSPEFIGRKGLVAPIDRPRAIQKVLNTARRLGLKSSNVIESPITGARSGNVEYLVKLDSH